MIDANYLLLRLSLSPAEQSLAAIDAQGEEISTRVRSINA
jgi:hypothetical protein